MKALLNASSIFYVAAMLGTFFTAASFLKLGHAAYLGKRNEEHKNVKEASWPMLIPMIVIAGICVVFGLWNALPLNDSSSRFSAERLAGHEFHSNMMLIVITVIVLVGALLHHLFAVKISGSGSRLQTIFAMPLCSKRPTTWPKKDISTLTIWHCSDSGALPD